jgi:Cu+-exporting ATPase
MSETVTIRIKGMTCAAHIQKAIERMDGVEAASLNFATEKLNVRYDPERVASEQIG